MASQGTIAARVGIQSLGPCTSRCFSNHVCGVSSISEFGHNPFHHPNIHSFNAPSDLSFAPLFRGIKLNGSFHVIIPSNKSPLDSPSTPRFFIRVPAICITCRIKPPSRCSRSLWSLKQKYLPTTHIPFLDLLL
jgi:hypothetical protein